MHLSYGTFSSSQSYLGKSPNAHQTNQDVVGIVILKKDIVKTCKIAFGSREDNNQQQRQEKQREKELDDST
jgi:hypothetical protein